MNDDLTDIKLIYQTKVDTTIYPSSITYIDYIMDQSSITRFLDYRYCDDMNDIPKEITMGNLFTSYSRLSDMKLNTDKQLPTYKKRKKAHYEFLAIRNFYATIVPYKPRKVI
ncbi:hypothetical protein MGH68_16165 [Erysipelothrix sp. D19-032]